MEIFLVHSKISDLIVPYEFEEIISLIDFRTMVKDLLNMLQTFIIHEVQDSKSIPFHHIQMLQHNSESSKNVLKLSQISCQFCNLPGSKFESMNYFFYHQNVMPHHKECPFCDLQFTDDRFLKFHLIKQHKKGIQCPTCKIYLDMPLLIAQRHIKNSVKTHRKVCLVDNCYIPFRSERDRLAHLKTVHGSKKQNIKEDSKKWTENTF